MRFVVAYDVNTEKPEGRRRLRRVAKACEARGQRVQDSVFECALDQAQYEALLHKLVQIVEKEEDSLRVYRLLEPFEKCVYQYGVNKAVDFEKPLVV